MREYKEEKEKERGMQGLEALLHASGDGTKGGVDFAGRATQDKADDGIPSDLDVLEGTENMNFAINEKKNMRLYEMSVSVSPPPPDQSCAKLTNRPIQYESCLRFQW